MVATVTAGLEAAGPHLGDVARAKGWKRTVERDLQNALEDATGAHSVRIELEHWPAVGPVDLMLSSRVAVELKWCKSGDTLANCAWDIAKLGCALMEGEVEDAYVVAGAPSAHWRGGRPGVELFAAQELRADDLVRRYESWWRFWCRDVATRPTALPSAVSVTPLDPVTVELDAEPFDLRAARIAVRDARWQPHVCPHRWRGETCSPRPGEPGGVGSGRA